MDEIKIGDIIQPTTPIRRKRFGKGIIVALKQAQRRPITAVFPTEDGSFFNFDFKENHVSIVKYNEEEHTLIADAAHGYRQLLEDLKSA